MNVENGTTDHESESESIEQRFAELKDNLEKLVHRFDTTPEGYLGKTRAQIIAHPLTAVGIAFGLGYLFVRIARRR